MASYEEILRLFSKNRELSVKEIVRILEVSKQTAHLTLNTLVNEKKIERLGRAPKTVYRLVGTDGIDSAVPPELDETAKSFLNKTFLAVTETGTLLEGLDAFARWCRQRKLPVEKTVREFINTKEKYAHYYSSEGWIDGMEKLANTKGFEKIWPDSLYYMDFYAIERFGKTRLGTLLHYAKQGQNKYLMAKMMAEVKPKILRLASLIKADAVGFVPPTIRREVQIMKFIQSDLRLSLPAVDIKKLSGIIPVPQKSLSNMDERIRNAEHTFAVTEQRNFKHVLLINDAVGSGATINQIAGKIKAKRIAGHVTGLAIVGSFKGFDVLTDV